MIASGSWNGNPIAPARRSPTKTGTASAPEAYGARAAPSGKRETNSRAPLRPGRLALPRRRGDRRSRRQRKARAGPQGLPASHHADRRSRARRPRRARALHPARRSPSARPRPSRSPPPPPSAPRRATAASACSRSTRSRDRSSRSAARAARSWPRRIARPDAADHDTDDERRRPAHEVVARREAERTSSAV